MIGACSARATSAQTIKPEPRSVTGPYLASAGQYSPAFEGDNSESPACWEASWLTTISWSVWA